jgi:acyl carrier protein
LLSELQRENAEGIADIIQDKLQRPLSPDRKTTLSINTPEELYFRVKEIVVDGLEVEEWEVIPTTHFIDDLNADSINFVEMVMRLEETFDIEIPDEDAEKLLTLVDIYNYLEGKVQLRHQKKKTQSQFPFRQ